MTDRPTRSAGAVRDVLRLAQARSRTTVGDRAYVLYMAVLLGLVAVGPALRAAWILLAEPAAVVAVAGVPLVWAASGAAAAVGAAVILGSVWGPAVRSPWLTRLFAESPLPRARAFATPLARAIAVSAVLAATVGAVMLGPATAAGAVPTGAGLCALGACALTGFVVGVALLAGQALGPRAPLVGAAIVVVAAAAAALALVPAVAGLRWLAMPSAPVALAVTAFLAVGAGVAIPGMLRSLRTPHLVAAALRAATAVESAASFDVGTITGIARSAPSAGRPIRAVARRGPLWLVFLRRDAVGALRTPDRILLAAVGLTAAALLAVAAAEGSPWFGAAAGIVCFLALAPLTDGVRHAAAVAVGPPVYGVSTPRLAVLHTLFPAAVSAAVGGIAWAATGSAFVLATASAIVAGALLMRVADAAKPHLPVELLTPIPTPMGDMAALLRLLWASDGILFAGLAGASAAAVVTALWWFAMVIVVIVAIAWSRWRSRR